MYDRYYKLRAEPFRLSPDHSFAYEHKGYKKARAYMAYAYLRAEGFVMVTGRPGTGKTTLVGALIEQLADENVSAANLVCTQLEADALLKMVAYEFGIDGTGIDKGELLQQLTRRLKSWHREGRRALLIVDEAQDLSVSAMEELRLLTNIQIDGRPLLQIFLLGQPELRELILSPKLEQVHQRIVAASHLEPLQRDEMEAYVRHRLESVGWRGNPAISRSIYPLIHKFSEGIPRRVNLICSRLFLHCAVEQRHEVCVSDVRHVVEELQGESLAVGTKLTDRDFAVADSFDEPRPGSRGGSAIADEKTPEAGIIQAPAPESVREEGEGGGPHGELSEAESTPVSDGREENDAEYERGKVVVYPRAWTRRLRRVPAPSGAACAAEAWDEGEPASGPTALDADGEAREHDPPVMSAGIKGAEEQDQLPSWTELAPPGDRGRAAGERRRDLSTPIILSIALASVLFVVWAAKGFSFALFGH